MVKRRKPKGFGYKSFTETEKDVKSFALYCAPFTDSPQLYLKHIAKKAFQSSGRGIFGYMDQKILNYAVQGCRVNLPHQEKLIAEYDPDNEFLVCIQIGKGDKAMCKDFVVPFSCEVLNPQFKLVAPKGVNPLTAVWITVENRV